MDALSSSVWLLIAFGVLALSGAQKTPEITYNITEELPLGTKVGSMSDLPNFFSNVTDRKQIQYIILGQGSPLFNISSADGVITVAQRIDRDVLCPVQRDCVQNITVVINQNRNSGYESRVVAVGFRIIDINDNAPRFDLEKIVLKFTEGNSPDSVLKITGANDADFNPEFKVKNYALNKFRNVFDLSASKALDGSSEIELRLRKSLDRETVPLYDFTITAYDGGSPPLSSVLNVTIEVTDVNDNTPVFLNHTYAVSLDGKISIGTVILQVSATDADEGKNALVSYDFSSIHKTSVEHFYQIDPASGNISVVGPLKPGTMEFIVEAQDSGNPPLKIQTYVSVNVVNTGNTPPRVSINTLGGGSDRNAVASVLEPGGRGLFVALVNVDDDDGDDVACVISNEVFKMEPVENKGYKIVLQGTVDRETRDTYNLSVACVDKGDPPLNTTAYLTVKIQDANDNAPEFTQNRYSRTLLEGRKKNEFVLKVSAADKDAGSNAETVYSFDPDYRSFFAMDPNTGVITAVGDLDREATPVMKFNVFATDKGAPPLTSTAEVVVILEDVNDNAPEFDTKIFRFQAFEEVQNASIIGVLAARDLDEGANSQMDFFFTGSLDGADGAFSVLPNGSILSTSKLDREERVNYSFSVMVRDKGNPPLMSTASVVIEVLDINDNAPIILFPKTPNHTILISTFPEPGAILSKVIAYDDDAGENGTLRFTLNSGNEDRAFEITEDTGEFKITNPSNLKNFKRYEIAITVSDRGQHPKFNTTSLKVDVQFDNMTRELAIGGGHKKQEDYIIIVAVVAAVTVVFSTLIIVAICVVFQKDRVSHRKNAPKGDFHNMHVSDGFNDEEKVNTIVRDSPFVASNQPYSMNNLSSPPSGDKQLGGGEDGTFFQVKHGHPGHNEQFQNSGKGKAVSFSIDETATPSPSSRHASPRDETPLFSTFGSPHSRSCDGDMYQQRSSMMRQNDDVTSDTSADTTTSDSGRGNSVDDVNFDQIMKGELSPRLSSRRRSDEFQMAPRKTMAPDTLGRASYHVRFSQTPDKSFPPELPPKQKSSSNPYEGGRHFSRVEFKDNPFASKMIGVHGQHLPSAANNNMHQKLNLLASRQLSVTSMDDDASTTTSGSYVINPDDFRMETFVGSDVIV
ncbi:unnamed protein product [Lymnaea stagnalis]|uniref:Cadherin domain-containing protein n=1 Tax=Lymnaea stagnalis TaxID=6523 RepID=A0AAV2HKI4_LYMST